MGAILGGISLLFAATTFIAASVQKDRYTAETSLVFRGRALGEAIPGALRLPSPETTPSAETTEKLLTLPAIAERTADGLPGDLSADEIADKVDLQMHPGSELVTLRATDPNPNSAAAIANAYAEGAIAFYRSVNRRIFRAAIKAGKGGAEGIDNPGRREQVEHILRQLGGRLKTFEVLQVGDLEQVDPATAPDEPSSPHVGTDVLLGLLVGICVGSLLVALAAARERIDDLERLEADIGAPVLGAFTEVVSSPRRHQALTDYVQLPPDLVDMLLARIRYYEPKRERRVVLVTSAAESEGKTTLSLNLADAAEGSDLVVVDGCAPASDDGFAEIPDRVDCVIVIARIGRATRRRTRALREMLRDLDAPVVGAVANFVSPEDPQTKPFTERQTGAPKLKVGT